MRFGRVAPPAEGGEEVQPTVVPAGSSTAIVRLRVAGGVLLRRRYPTVNEWRCNRGDYIEVLVTSRDVT